ncbi:TonB-dependent receptor [Helicobacter sp. MIT 21-1697]|uniref:TonB-dependent receptor plug domain-containing protein n=1 Tax=Helicobacter sp. MIT 21-1697 TaxID=2993733 RepID=UPI00224A7F32|nr:TonB-dependent receptor [Helicobacter sp. MIT 21-1697]MCX2716646.1 TonB-dependent receptor [Helicobacter sp. MIT 21-1697]
MKSISHTILIPALTSMTFTNMTRADEYNTSKSVNLSPLVTTAQAVSHTNVSVIDSKFIANTQARDLREVFNKNAEIQVGGSSQIAQKLYIRGFEDRMFRVRIDGITQSGNLLHHQGNLFFDPFLVKNIEIEKGLANVEYGAGALAGGINITTKNAFDLLGANRNYGAHFNIGGQTNKGVDTSLATYGKIKENFGLVASYNFDDVPYYRSGDGNKVSSSPAKAHNALFKLTFLPKENHSFNVNYHFNNVNSVSPYAANILTLGASPQLYASKLFAHSVSTQYDYLFNKSFHLHWNAFYSRKNLSLSPTGIYSSRDHEDPRDLLLSNLGSDISLKHYFGESRHSLKYGLNYQLISTKERYLTTESLKNNNRAYEKTAIYGGFIGANFNLLESLSLELGSRYDSFVYEDKVSKTHNTQGFSPYVSLLYTPINELSLKITQNYNTRGVMPMDASILADPSVTIKPLKAEGMHNTEFDMDYDNSLFSAHIALYHQYLKNFINTYVNNASNTAVHGSENFSRQNMDSAIRILGYEANIGLDFSFVDVHLGVAQNFPTYNNKTITDTFELMAVSGRSYYLSAGLRPFSALPQFQILWLSRFSEGIDYQGYNMYRGELASINKKAYNVHNIYFTYDVKSYLSLRLAFLNITNKTYANPYTPLNELYSMDSGNTPLYEPGFSTKFQIALSF